MRVLVYFLLVLFLLFSPAPLTVFLVLRPSCSSRDTTNNDDDNSGVGDAPSQPKWRGALRKDEK
jgi:hypothetical protein